MLRQRGLQKGRAGFAAPYSAGVPQAGQRTRRTGVDSSLVMNRE
jgi:hypothetical protein